MKLLFSTLALTFALPTFASTTSSAPFVGSLGMPKKVLGQYIRTQIQDSEIFPFRTIGQLSTGCTGTLIGPKHVITAAHCVFDSENHHWYNDLDFSPGKTSESNTPFGVITWKKIFIQNEYLESGDPDHDFAVIELEEAIGEKVGWSGFKVLPKDEYANAVRMTGYPGDKAFGSMWSVTCPSKVEENTIYYKCDTFGGMSGSAIYSLQKDPTQHYVTAVHTWGSEDSNGGIILNSSNFQLINSWIKETAVSSNTVIHKKSEL